MKKNIGRIFRGHNIIEYKNPRDNLTINDFYKVTAYCFFYQSDMETVCAIPPQELTITFICNRYPYKLIRHLKEFWKMKIEYRGSGIYYLTGFSIPIQILLTRELDPDENLWLRSLRTDLKDEKEITNVIKKFEENRHSKLRQAAMDAITRANWKAIREVKDIMCDALKELMAEELEEAENKGIEQGIRALINTCKKLNVSEKITLDRLQEEFSLSEEKAKQAIKKYS